MSKVNLVFLFLLIVICHWQVECGKKQENDWFLLYQRLESLQIGLVENKNLDQYMNLSVYSNNDSRVFTNDSTKAKRSYNTEQCIKDLKTIQVAFRDGSSNWANESKRISVFTIFIFITKSV